MNQYQIHETQKTGKLKTVRAARDPACTIHEGQGFDKE